jgi:hypothetical protein
MFEGGCKNNPPPGRAYMYGFISGLGKRYSSGTRPIPSVPFIPIWENNGLLQINIPQQTNKSICLQYVLINPNLN